VVFASVPSCLLWDASYDLKYERVISARIIGLFVTRSGVCRFSLTYVDVLVMCYLYQNCVNCIIINIVLQYDAMI
jgi:hypothetical protein